MRGTCRKLYPFMFLLGFVFIIRMGAIAAPPVDTTPPLINITNPHNWDGLTGIVNVTVYAKDSQTGVSAVIFSVEGTNVWMVDSTYPYAFSWDTRLHADGVYKITCYADDKCPEGPNRSCTTIQVLIKNNGPVNTFIVSRVVEGSETMNLMSSGLKNLGYTSLAAITNITSESMINCLQTSIITCYYHIGHGGNGKVYTSNGQIQYNSTMIRAQNTIFSTCTTLAETAWKNFIGSTAKTLLGYYALLLQSATSPVANRMLAELKQGRSYAKAWHLSNAGVAATVNRWVAYVREGSNVVEYSVRAGKYPQAVAPSSMLSVGESGRVFMAPDLLSQNLIGEKASMSMIQAISDRVVTEVEKEEFADFGPMTISDKEAVRRAEIWLSARNALPKDAVLDQVFPLQRRIDANSPAVIIGYQVRYRRELNGVKIMGNGIEDHIVVLVGAKKIVSVSRYWPNLLIKETAWQPSRLMRIDRAIWTAADDIARVIDREFRIVRAELVYGTRGPLDRSSDVVPAYAVYNDNGLRLVIDAQTGRLLF